MRMIGCVSRPTGGELRVLGLDPATDGQRIRARLGVVPQEDNLDTELSVCDNLIIYGRYFGISRGRCCASGSAELLEFVQLDDRADSRVDPLSGGMKRRLTIARALVNEPDLILLDEPTTGLDPQARHLVWERLYQLKQRGVTQVLTTHYMDEAERLCDRLVIMDDGRIVDEGSPSRAHRAPRHPRGRRAAPADATASTSRLALDPMRALGPPHRGRSPTGCSSTPTTATRWSRTLAGRRAAPRLGARAPQHARGRVPDPHRPHPDRGLSGRGPGSLRVVEREALIYRRLWRGDVFSTFVEPVALPRWPWASVSAA